MPFKNANVAAGLAKNAAFQVGRADVDAAAPAIEQGATIPWASGKRASWVYFECTPMVVLDSGIVVHHQLPQVDNAPDTLASCRIDDPNLDTIVGPGVNLKCLDQYRDVVQRMGHARYWLRLYGQALRLGYQVPIPGVKTIGGVPAIPYDKNPQWAFNRIAPGGNYGGVILWHAVWSLWYTTAVPPVNNTNTVVDPMAHIISTAVPPASGMQAPYSQPDDNAQPAGPSGPQFVINKKGL